MKAEHRQYILENAGKKSPQQIAKELGLREKVVKKLLENERRRPAVQGGPAPSLKAAASPAAAGAPSGQPLEKFPTAVLLAALGALGFLIYSSALGGAFLFDDAALVRDNPFIKSFSQLPKLFTENIWAGVGIEYFFYRPLQMVTYLIDHALWGMDPKGYHLTSIAVHVLTAWAMFCLVWLLFANRWLAFLTALFFVVHPVHTEAVTYIAGRADPLVALFMLLTLGLYVKLGERKDAKLLLLLAVSYALALLSKEYALILPALALVYHLALKKKVNWPAVVTLGAVFAAYLALRTLVLHSAAQRSSAPGTFGERLPGVFISIASYLRLLVAPINLHMEYGSRVYSFDEPAAGLGLILTAALFIYAFIKRRSEPLIYFSVLWFFVALVPVSNLFPLNATMAEHWLYLPSLGFFLLLAYFLDRLYRSGRARNLSLALIVGVVGVNAYLTFRQNDYWKDSVTFYSRTLKHNSQGARMYNNLGSEYNEMGRREEAIEMFKKALDNNPSFAAAHENLAIAYYYTNRYALAVQHFDKAITLGYPVNQDLAQLLEPHRQGEGSAS